MIKYKAFYFLRHGRTEWNHRKLIQGQTDIPLDEEGVQQAVEAAEHLVDLSIDKIFYSPLKRASETAQILNEQLLEPKPSICLDSLMERHWGEWQGMTSTTMYELEEKELNDPSYTVGKGAESLEAFRNRVCEGVNHALDNSECPLIVSHGRVFLVLCDLLQIPRIQQIKNAAPIKCYYDEGRWKIEQNETLPSPK